MEHKQKRKKKEEEEREINELLYSIMDGYSDKVIAPLSQFSPLMEDQADAAAAAIVEAKGSSSRKRVRPKEEVTESLKRERYKRKKMAENYDLLQSMVPNLPPKATREKIVGETIAYIESLEKELKRLEEVKKNSCESKEAKGKRLQQQYSNKNNSSINVTVSNNVAFFGIQSPVIRPSLVTDIFMVFHKHKAEVLAANVTVNDQRQITLTVTASVGNGNEDSTLIFENIKRDILVL